MDTPAFQDKRLWATLAGVAVTAMNKKLNLGLDAQDMLSIGGLIAMYVAQSQAGAIAKAKAAGVAAAAQVVTPKDALKTFDGTPLKVLALALCLGLAFTSAPAFAADTTMDGGTVLPVVLPDMTSDVPHSLTIQSGAVVDEDGGTVAVRGGCFLDSVTCVTVGKEVAALRAENTELKKGPGTSPVVIVLSITVAVLGGFMLGRAVK